MDPYNGLKTHQNDINFDRCFLRQSISSVLRMQTLWVDPYNGLKTHQNDIIFDRGMSFEAACRKLEHEKGAEDASSFRRSRRPIFGRTMFLLAVQKVGTPGVFSICRPNTGTSFFDMEVQPLACMLHLMCSVLGTDVQCNDLTGSPTNLCQLELLFPAIPAYQLL